MKGSGTLVNARKIGFAILVAVLYLAGTSPASVFAQAETLMLQETIAGGISADADIREAKQALMKANASLNEAFYAILNSMEKDMFLIPMQQRSITRDVELALKSAESMKALVIAEAELEAAERKVRADVERLYVTAYQSQRVVKRAGQRLAERKHALQETELLHRFGRASREQVEAAREAVKQAESELKQAQLSYNRDKIELGTRIGRELERVDLELRVERYYVPLTQDAMWRFVHKALRDDLELVKANEEMKLAEAKVAAVRAAMSRKFTPLMTASIEAMFDGTEQYVTGEIHYDMLIAELDSMIFTADALWYTVIPIRIPVPPFVLPLPLKPIQGEHDGARYFEDERLILPNSMMELDTARQRVHDLRQDVVQNIKTSYLNAKQAEETYAQMLRLKAQAERALKAAEQQRRFGVYTEEQLAGSKRHTRKRNRRHSMPMSLTAMRCQPSTSFRPGRLRRSAFPAYCRGITWKSRERSRSTKLRQRRNRCKEVGRSERWRTRLKVNFRSKLKVPRSVQKCTLCIRVTVSRSEKRGRWTRRLRICRLCLPILKICECIFTMLTVRSSPRRG